MDSINTERSYTEYEVTEPTTDFAIGFDNYSGEDKDAIHVTLDGVNLDDLNYTVVRKNAQVIEVTPAIESGVVRIQRETYIDQAFHKFTAGALFSPKSVDENFAQVRRSQQEVNDGFTFLAENTNGVVQASKEATAQAKAATVEATASAVRAETAADTAVQAVDSLQGVVDAATTATAEANSATATANTAASQATAATTSAQNATQAANTAKQEADAATANANAATVDTLAATGRANEAADVVADLVVGKVRAQDVSTSDDSTQDVKNTEFQEVKQDFLKSSELLEANEYLFIPSTATDHAQELNDTLDYCFDNNLRAKPIGEFNINSKVVIKGAFDGSRATFITKTVIPIAVEISTGIGENPTTVVRLTNEETIILPNVINGTKPVTGWLGQGIGVRYVNVQNTKITERMIENFGVGVQHTAYSAGCGYCDVQAGYLRNNKVNRQFKVGDETGWTNRWDFHGGRYYHSSAEVVGAAGGIVEGMMHFDVVPNSTGYIINDINHFGGSLEGNGQEYHLRLGGSYINFWGVRFESLSSANSARVHLAAQGITGQGSANGLHYGRGVTDAAIVVTKDSLAGANFTLSSNLSTSKRVGSNILQVLQTTSSSALPALAFLDAGASSGANANTDYGCAIGSHKLVGKRSTDAFNKIELDFQGSKINIGDGTTEPTLSIGRRGTNTLTVSAHLTPIVKGTHTSGAVGLEWSAVHSSKYMFTATVGAFYGAGSPEGVVEAGVGSTYHCTDGSAGTCFYVKETGVGTAGWVAK